MVIVQADEPRGLPALPAIAALGLPSMPQIQLPSNAALLTAPLPAPKNQGPASAVDALEQPYRAFYRVQCWHFSACISSRPLMP